MSGFYGAHQPRIVDLSCTHAEHFGGESCDVFTTAVVCDKDEEDWPCEVARAYDAGALANGGDSMTAIDVHNDQLFCPTHRLMFTSIQWWTNGHRVCPRGDVWQHDGEWERVL